MSAKADRARRINLGDANTRRTVTAGQQDAVILRQALERVPYCPPLYRKVAEARIAAPAVPWSVLARLARDDQGPGDGVQAQAA